MPTRGIRWDHTMKRIILAATTALLLLASTPARAAPPSRLTDAQVRQQIIRESIARYPGVCACPYNTARNGSRCGRRSAYSRPGGYSPKCFPADVSKQEIKSWRAFNRR